MSETLARAAAASPPKAVPCSRARILRSFRVLSVSCFILISNTAHSGASPDGDGTHLRQGKGGGGVHRPSSTCPRLLHSERYYPGPLFILGHWFALPKNEFQFLLLRGSRNPNTYPTSAASRRVGGDEFPPLPMPDATYS